MNKWLMRSIVELAAFLALSEDNIIDSDAAISQLENLASTLKELTQEEQRTFAKYIEELAISEPIDADNNERKEFLLSLPENLGLES